MCNLETKPKYKEFFELLLDSYKERINRTVKREATKDRVDKINEKMESLFGRKMNKNETNKIKKKVAKSLPANSATYVNCFEQFIEDCKKCRIITHAGKLHDPYSQGCGYVEYDGINNGYIATHNTKVPLLALGITNGVIKLLEQNIGDISFHKHLIDNTDEARKLLNYLKSKLTANDITDLIENGKVKNTADNYCPKVFLKKNDALDGNDDVNYDVGTILPNLGVAKALDKYIRDIQTAHKAKINPSKEYIPNSNICARYFGDKAQTINSALKASPNNGTLWTLLSMPRSFMDKNYQKVPTRNIFNECIYISDDTKKRLQQYIDTHKIRYTKNAIHKLIKNIVDDCVFLRSKLLDKLGEGWTSDNKYANLAHQAYWLDSQYDDWRKEAKNRRFWEDKFADNFAYSLGTYGKKDHNYIKSVFKKFIRNT